MGASFSDVRLHIRGRASARAWLCRLLGFARLGAGRLARGCRLNAERPPRGDRGGRGRGLRLPEIHPAAGRKLRFVPDHAGRDAIDIRNLGAAKAKRIAAARLLLLLGIGLACTRQHRSRQRRCEHQDELELAGPDSKHESPKALPLRIVGEWRGIGKQSRWSQPVVETLELAAMTVAMSV
jgi:hypothetical protein